MRPSLLLPLVTIVLGSSLLACPKRVQTPSPEARAEQPETELAQLRREVAAITKEVGELLDAQNLGVWRAWIHGVPMDLGEIYAGHELLFTEQTIARVARLIELTEDPQEIRSLTALHVHLVGEHLAAKLAEPDEAIATLEASLTFPVGDDEIRWRDVERLLTAEPNPKKRRALYEGAAVAGARLAPLLRRRAELLEEELLKLGFPESGATLAYAAELRQSDFVRLEKLAEELLTVTEEPYRTVMDRLARRELSQPFSKLTRADVPRLFRKSQVDDAFPAKESIARSTRTLEGLGLPSYAELELDVRDVPEKNPRPLSLLVEDQVHVSLKPRAGAREQGAILRELGHALALTPIAGSEDVTRRLGNVATAQSFGVLLSDLVEDPIWLEDFAGLSGKRRADYLASANAHRLYLLRQLAGRLLYQLALLRERIPVGTNEARQAMKALMQRSSGLPTADVDVLWTEWSLGDLLSEADALRAAFLAAQMQSELKGLGGPAWWRSPEAGKALTQWIQASAGKRPGEMAQLLGAPGLQVDSLLLRMGTALGVPIQVRGDDGERTVE